MSTNEAWGSNRLPTTSSLKLRLYGGDEDEDGRDGDGESFGSSVSERMLNAG